jgi:hypothetical protein
MVLLDLMLDVLQVVFELGAGSPAFFLFAAEYGHGGGGGWVLL